MMLPFLLLVPSEPEMALTIRVFIVAAGQRLSIAEADLEDLRLTATELLANAIDHHTAALELTLTTERDAWQLTARGAGELDDAPVIDGLPVRRIDILRSLTEVRIDDGLVVCSPADVG
jgi:anti-sigma regulatory factor (Ser/Thr protein kinase)